MASGQDLRQYLDAGLHALTTRARQLERLDGEVRRLLPELGGHCRVANVRRGTLVLQADSPAWASRLRYQTRSLLGQLQHRGYANLNAVQVRIAPATAERRPPPRRARLSNASGELLRQTAEDLDNPALRAALRRLARRAGRGE